MTIAPSEDRVIGHWVIEPLSDRALAKAVILSGVPRSVSRARLLGARGTESKELAFACSADTARATNRLFATLVMPR